jgi:hypothetical protein
MAREDLNPVEEARACVMLTQEFGLTYRQIAERAGRHNTVVANLMRLLNLSGVRSRRRILMCKSWIAGRRGQGLEAASPGSISR